MENTFTSAVCNKTNLYAANAELRGWTEVPERVVKAAVQP